MKLDDDSTLCFFARYGNLPQDGLTKRDIIFVVQR
jgi:hypothetical protein